MTTLARGTVRITTAVGSAFALYDASVLVLVPIVNSVSPAVWSTTQPTEVTITGERYGPVWDMALMIDG